MNKDSPTFWEDANFYAGMILVFAGAVFISTFLMRYLFAIVGENLIFNVRRLLFESIVYKHISWFDSKEKATGILSNILSEDIILLNGLTTETFAIYAEAISTVIIGFSLSFYYTW